MSSSDTFSGGDGPSAMGENRRVIGDAERRGEEERVIEPYTVVGLVPTVWGISQDMATSIDRVALWNIVATVDAFLSAGFTPTELMRWVHPSLVASTQGTGMGGMTSMQTMSMRSRIAIATVPRKRCASSSISPRARWRTGRVSRSGKPSDSTAAPRRYLPEAASCAR